jgi:hypothetical protein
MSHFEKSEKLLNRFFKCQIECDHENEKSFKIDSSIFLFLYEQNKFIIRAWLKMA